MIRRLALQLAVAVAVAVLASGCVRQPVDESAFTRDPSLGIQADPLAPKEARRFAREAIEQPTEQRRKLDREVAEASPTPAPAGGLVRDPEDDGDEAGAVSGTSDRTTGDRTRDTSGSGSNDSNDSGSRTRDGSRDDRGEEEGGDGGDRETSQEQPPSPPPPSNPFKVVAGSPDPEGDAGRDAPGYADTRGITFESDRQTLRVTVAFSANVPSVLSAGEVQGVGVDFFRSDDRESDYQLFADGGSDGWTAYLETPEGFVQYPGTFQVGGRVIRFEVPWSALGGAEPADVSSFVDWSKERTPLNEIGNDVMPDRGRLALRP